VQGFSGRPQRTCFVFLRQKSAEAYIMDSRDTPGYRLYRTLRNLNSIDSASLPVDFVPPEGVREQESALED
jgi:hypothetical protein